MDYTKIPEVLIYRKRMNLDEFGVDDQTPLKINPFLYERLLTVDFLNPKWGRFDELLRIFNDVYYILTLIFLEKRPIEHYKFYCDIASKSYILPDDHQSKRQLVEMCMLYIILRPFHIAGNLPIQQVRLLEALERDIKADRSRFEWSISQTLDEYLESRDNLGEDIVDKMTYGIADKRFFMNFKEDFAPRDIQEVIDSKESLKSCLSAGDILRDAVNTLCSNDAQKILLIDRLLEPEKEGYGILDCSTRKTYRCLYELKSELTGEPLPEKLPFEMQSESLKPQMLPDFIDNSPCHLQNNENTSNQGTQSEEKIKELVEEKENLLQQLGEAEALIEELKEENEIYKNQSKINEELSQWYTNECNYKKLTGEETFTRRERVVFFATVLSLDINKKYTILQNLATFIAELCTGEGADDIGNIASFLSRMQAPKEKKANAKAAKRVSDLLQLIVPEESRNDQKLTINKTIESLKLNFPENDEE